jgi:gamma-glutamyltranspeptidase/glutathione hydrolase
MKSAIAVLGLMVLSAGCGDAEESLSQVGGDKNPPGPDLFAKLPERTPTAIGRNGAAATVDVRATLAAIEILKKGGNAIDASVAAASVISVTDPFSCGIGGGGFMVIYLAGEKRVVTIDNRETAPARMDYRLYYDEAGVPIPFDDLVTSGLGVGVPGTVRGWDEALRRFGKLGFKDVLSRATWIAEESGFDVDKFFSDQIGRNVERFKAFPATSKLYLTSEGQPLPIGTIFKNPDLGKTYRLIVEGGAKAFYEGEIAGAIVDTVQHPAIAAGTTLNVRPGVMEPGDLADYQALVRPPVVLNYRGYTMYGMGLPSSGGLTIGMSLNLLAGYDLKSLTPVEILQRYLGATRLAYADRGAYMGDPEYVDAPEVGLLSEGYAAERRPLIDLTKAPTSKALPGNPYAYQNDKSTVPPPSGTGFTSDSAYSADDLDFETTHITVTDKDGNIVAYTCTIEQEGGSGMVVPGYGFLLNNELTDFDVPTDLNATHPNALEAGKRPRSSMSPTIVFKDGKPDLTLGTPGGSSIITTVLQTMVNYIDRGMTIEQALAAPRASQRNSSDGSTIAETAFISSPEAMELMGLGHVFNDKKEVDGEIGTVTALRFNPDGTVTAATEPVRRTGCSAMVVDEAK